MFFLTPLGSAAVLAGIGVFTYQANEATDHRYGMEDDDGHVPLWGDYRVWAAGLGYLATMFGPHQLRGVGQVAMLSSLASVAATEAIEAKDSGHLFGFDISGFLPASEATEGSDASADADSED